MSEGLYRSGGYLRVIDEKVVGVANTTSRALLDTCDVENAETFASGRTVVAVAVR